VILTATLYAAKDAVLIPFMVPWLATVLVVPIAAIRGMSRNSAQMHCLRWVLPSSSGKLQICKLRGRCRAWAVRAPSFCWGNVRRVGPGCHRLSAAREMVSHWEHSRILSDHGHSHEKPAANLDGFSCRSRGLYFLRGIFNCLAALRINAQGVVVRLDIIRSCAVSTFKDGEARGGSALGSFVTVSGLSAG
jgi:hypothetical protein